MKPGALFAAVSMALLGALVLGGCGKADDPRAAAIEAAQEALHAGLNCEIPPRDGSHERIDVGDSGLPCIEAVGIANLVPRDWRRPQAVPTEGDGTWRCIHLPASAAPIVLRCSHDQRSFTVERLPAD